jgi:ribosome-associated protein
MIMRIATGFGKNKTAFECKRDRPMKEPHVPTSQNSEDAWRLPGGIRVPAEALRIQSARSSGPGGQNVNKVNTKMELWIDPSDIQGLREDAAKRLLSLAGHHLTAAGEIHLTSQSERSQEQNRRAVLEKLRKLIVMALVRPKPRRATRPTAGSRARRLNAKRIRSQTKSQRARPDVD